MDNVLTKKVISAVLASTIMMQAVPMNPVLKGVLPVDVSAISVKAAENALVIEEERTLTEDLVVETDLVIRAKLDLNGHKLTAKKNVTIEYYDSSLVFSKGTATIMGNLYASENSSILMENKADSLCVYGEAVFNGSATLTAGTMEFKGDVSGNSISTSDMHNVIFSGEENQNISAEMNLYYPLLLQ